MSSWHVGTNLASVVVHGTPQASGRFLDTGAGFIITFDKDTDYGVGVPLGGSFECPLLLDYNGASDEDVCSWTSGKLTLAW